MRTATGTRGGPRLAPAPLGLVLVALVVGACSPAAVASPVVTASPPLATPSATASPTPSPTASPTLVPSAATVADPSEGLKIASPYTLNPLSAALETTFRQQFAASAGAFGSLIGIGGREVVNAGALAGYVIVFGFPTGVLNDTSYQSVLAGMAASSKITFKTTTISGVIVSTGSSNGANYAMFRVGDHVIMVVALQAAAAPAIAQALITANQ
jgi:hypothetical protein